MAGDGIPLAAGAGRWPLAAGRWPLAAGRWPLAAGRLPPAAGRWPLAAAATGSGCRRAGWRAGWSFSGRMPRHSLE